VAVVIGRAEREFWQRDKLFGFSFGIGCRLCGMGLGNVDNMGVTTGVVLFAGRGLDIIDIIVNSSSTIGPFDIVDIFMIVVCWY